MVNRRPDVVIGLVYAVEFCIPQSKLSQKVLKQLEINYTWAIVIKRLTFNNINRELRKQP